MLRFPLSEVIPCSERLAVSTPTIILYTRSWNKADASDGGLALCVHHLLLNLFQQFFCGHDALVFAETVAFVFDIDVAFIS